MVKKVLILVVLISIPLSEIAAKSYTPSQLRSMVNSGDYPDQGGVSTETQSISFSACVTKVKGVLSSVSGQYPYKIIVNTNVLYTSKLWTNDAAMTLSCSSLDRKLVITTAKYK
ncbi:hypothetical protein [Oceanicoccus sagamiensis]|uniref:Uncharacterized protein n=1 Tax=Oceanicoccus sagamiensis TaxID=716816 RepID=A0A1X9NEN0_9GAMM|nr:hypothetical protein [Oceanicoccus sagamiensis]ARN74892.1 hypothetical protein BST96_12665 [Oceanicoccus sagamiensis]